MRFRPICVIALFHRLQKSFYYYSILTVSVLYRFRDNIAFLNEFIVYVTVNDLENHSVRI